MMHDRGDLRIDVRVARTAVEVAACKELSGRVYFEQYGVKLTEGRCNPLGYRERFPDRFAMGFVDGEFAACAGLYVRDTYVERFGRVDDRLVASVLEEAGCPEAIDRPRVEYTKVVVDPDFGGKGIGRRFIGMTHARDFLEVDGEIPLLFVCARHSVFRLWQAVGIRTRPLRDFPWYRNHERYRSSADPMESRLVIPELDIDHRWFNLRYPDDQPEILGAIHAV